MQTFGAHIHDRHVFFDSDFNMADRGLCGMVKKRNRHALAQLLIN